jgi:protein-disulfide isomerase
LKRGITSGAVVAVVCGALGLLGLTSGRAWPASPPGAAVTVVAEVGPEVITAEALDQALGPRRYRSEQQRYEFQRLKLEELIDDELFEQEAARRGLSVERLKEIEIKARVGVSSDEVDTFYRERKNSLPASEAAAKDALRRYLEQQREVDATRQFVERLRARTPVTVKLDAPPPLRDYLVVPRAPVAGPRDAPVTIVEFSDFQCQFCATAHRVLKQVLAAYPREVRLVYRHFPLGGHPAAKPAAEAAECAGQQGRFWEYHDRLFAQPAAVDATRFRTIADELGLDGRAFASCLDGGSMRSRVSQDVDEGRRAGVTATPTFFVDGQLLEGAQPFEKFKSLIDLHLTLRPPRGVAHSQ